MFKINNIRNSILILCAFLSACSAIAKVENEAVVDLPGVEHRYSAVQHTKHQPLGDVLFLLAFSGGGTRAAALSYGVLEELKDTQYQNSGNGTRLLDEVDRISSVSGGSFTSAYYGLFGDQIFDDFKDVFLYKNIQGELSDLVLTFSNFIGSMFSTESRTEKVIDYYDEHIFRGKTFADLKRSGPFILINATDLNSSSQFVFVQNQFDFLCSDLSQFKIARAVAASSAVPILFPPVILKKHEECNFQKPGWLSRAEIKADKEDDLRLQESIDSLNFYLDKNNPPYVTLVDGGITDNLGLRTVMRNISLSGGAHKYYNKVNQYSSIKQVVMIVVDASTRSENDIGNNQSLPPIGDIVSSVTSIQLHLYNTETSVLLKEKLKEWVQTISTEENPISSYYININATAIEDEQHRNNFNAVPTSFSLEKEQADMLIDTAKSLLRQNPEYKRLLSDLNRNNL